ncbi:ubiquitin carboxyl-terminal hydrolase 14-like [Populus alba x Populus x berolinensis]|nr:ubiquitin carboxyl-terminal hydrolase 14-like [Populus alba x Populus x berolinensis]
MSLPQIDNGVVIPPSRWKSLQKTEMTTAERELDQNNYDWNRIQESGQDVEPIFGPGYTGLVSLGNNCYMAATMQVVFSTRSFNSRYCINQSSEMAFEMAPADPTADLNTQLTKLAPGMLPGKQSVPALENDDKANARTTLVAGKGVGKANSAIKQILQMNTNGSLASAIFTSCP